MSLLCLKTLIVGTITSYANNASESLYFSLNHHTNANEIHIITLVLQIKKNKANRYSLMEVI